MGDETDSFPLPQKQKMDLTTTEPFSDTFGTKAQRKRPRLDVGSIAELANMASTQQATTSAAAATAEADASHADTEQSRAPEDVAAEYEASLLNNVPRDYILSAGTSRRIWGELYKVCLILWLAGMKRLLTDPRSTGH